MLKVVAFSHGLSVKQNSNLFLVPDCQINHNPWFTLKDVHHLYLHNLTAINPSHSDVFLAHQDKLHTAVAQQISVDNNCSEKGTRLGPDCLQWKCWEFLLQQRHHWDSVQTLFWFFGGNVETFLSDDNIFVEPNAHKFVESNACSCLSCSSSLTAWSLLPTHQKFFISRTIF